MRPSQRTKVAITPAGGWILFLYFWALHRLARLGLAPVYKLLPPIRFQRRMSLSESVVPCLVRNKSREATSYRMDGYILCNIYIFPSQCFFSLCFFYFILIFFLFSVFILEFLKFELLTDRILLCVSFLDCHGSQSNCNHLHVPFFVSRLKQEKVNVLLDGYQI